MQDAKTIDTPPVHLLRGQSLYTRLPRGTVFHVASGVVSVATRARLDDSVLDIRVPVYRGGTYRVLTSGWFDIAATKDARLHGLGILEG